MRQAGSRKEAETETPTSGRANERCGIGTPEHCRRESLDRSALFGCWVFWLGRNGDDDAWVDVDGVSACFALRFTHRKNDYTAASRTRIDLALFQARHGPPWDGIRSGHS